MSTSSVLSSQAPPRRAPEAPILSALDLVRWRRRNGMTIIAVIGPFDSITLPEAIAVHTKSTPFADSMIALVAAAPQGAIHDLESRIRLALQIKEIECAIPFGDDLWSLVEAINPDLIVDMRESKSKGRRRT